MVLALTVRIESLLISLLICESSGKRGKWLSSAEFMLMVPSPGCGARLQLCQICSGHGSIIDILNFI